MTNPQPHGVPTEDEVRAIVTRIVDGIAGTARSAPDGEDSAAPGDEPPSPEAGAGRIAIGADHGGFALKERIGFKLKEQGWEVVDCGTEAQDPVDYPDFAVAVARKVASGECRWGIMVDGAGIGSAMAANKVPGVRASLCYDVSSAHNAREHNHANVLTLGAGLIGEALAWQIVIEWLSTEWAGGRHARRVAKIDALDRQYSTS